MEESGVVKTRKDESALPKFLGFDFEDSANACPEIYLASHAILSLQYTVACPKYVNQASRSNCLLAFVSKPTVAWGKKGPQNHNWIRLSG